MLKYPIALLLLACALGCARQQAAVSPREVTTPAEPSDTGPEVIAAQPEPVYEGKSVGQWVAALSAAKGEERAQASQALAELGADAVPALQRALEAKDPALRAGAAQTLRELEQNAQRPIPGIDVALSAAAKAMLKDFKDGPEATRVRAAEALGYLGEHGAPAVGELAAALKGQPEPVRATAAWALGHIGEEAADALPALAEALKKDDSAAVRLNAAEALGAIGAEPAVTVPALRGAVGDKEESVRLMAIEALGNVGKDAVPALVEVVKSPDVALRRKAIDALYEVGEDAAPAVPVLVTALKDDDPEVRRLAAQTLRKVDPKAAKDAGVK